MPGKVGGDNIRHGSCAADSVGFREHRVKVTAFCEKAGRSHCQAGRIIKRGTVVLNRQEALTFRSRQVVGDCQTRHLQEAPFEGKGLLERSSDLRAAHFLDDDVIDEGVGIQQVDDANLTAGQVFPEAAAVNKGDVGVGDGDESVRE